MADQNNNDYGQMHEAVLSEERRRLARQKETAEAHEEAFKNLISKALKDPLNKKNIGKDAFKAAKESELNGPNAALQKYGQGLAGGFVGAEFTGFNEDRPWERGTDEEE